MGPHLVLYKGCHFRIEWIHQLLWPLDHGYIQSQFPKVFRHFQPDETAPCNHS